MYRYLTPLKYYEQIIKIYVQIICDVPQEKGASRKIPKLFWDTCGKVAGKLWESCGKSCRDLRESCGKFDGSLREKAGKSCGELREVPGFRK